MEWVRQKWARWALIALAVLVFAYVASWLFGFTGDICDPPDPNGYQDCDSYNAVLVALWKIFKAFDDASAIITALATFAIAWLTRTLVIVSDQQESILKQQMVAEHRPILKVRHVALVEDSGAQLTRLPGVGEKVSGGLAVVNLGGTAAKVIDSRYLIYFAPTRDGLPMISPMDERFDTLLVPETRFKIGESIAVPISGIVTAEHPRGTFLPLGRDYTVYVMGQIQYQDEGGNNRFMGFCRKWQGEGTFQMVLETDYEYAD